MIKYDFIKEKLLKNKKLNLSENIVIEYDDYFYKTPNPIIKSIVYKGEIPFDYLSLSHEIIKEYFWDICNISETEIFNDKDFWFIIKQNKIEWKVFSKDDLKNNILKNKLRLTFEINKKLWEEKWYSLDFLWAQILYKPFCLHNLIVKNDEICLFDFWLLNKNANCFLVRYIFIIVYFLQNIILKFYLK